MGDLSRPSDGELRAALSMLKPWRRLASPVVLGLDGVPASGPLLFVGNHTLYGVLDVPLLFAELYERRGIFLRSLGDHGHFAVPVWRELLQRFGTVDGTRENCARLMRDGERILVFPGGGREVAKRKGERYKLQWKERLGFARMAIAHGCTIVPFASVGVEHAFDVVWDADDLWATPMGRWLDKLGVRKDVVPPLARGFLGTPWPRPERLYFRFAPPIETRALGGARGAEDDGVVRALRDRVRAAVQDGIEELLVVREQDPQRSLRARLKPSRR